ncbi:MAG: S8 family serine peptidase [Mycobacteriales bacterium]
MNKPVLAGVAATALVAGLIAAWRPATVAAAPPAAGPAAAASTVTLVTGDKVTLRGRHLTFTPARDDTVGSSAHWTDRYGDVHVVPGQAMAAVSDGRLDGRLFDVSELVREGYDDAHRQDVPLLVSGTAKAPAGLAALALPAAGLTAFAAPKARAGQVWRSLPATAKVWLDARIKVDDTDTLAQVGAPDAWAAGYTGAGVTVAVLDSGYDETHPDLAGKVTAAQDFTGGGSVHDGLGHGTHVASILAGTGRATGEVGVARDAGLIVGKVLGDDGYGQDSWVLAGLAWAAPRARIVNLSLGSYPTDGTDPVSQAIDDLTARYGTLFVVAAGNDSGGGGQVTAPATADAALAVGAVSKKDTLASFSSKGPRRGDAAVKPDLAAPGVDVVAARAAGTSLGAPRDQYATSLSGTSMATPHVAGGAALLAQEHPNWTADQLKAALMDSAHPVTGADIYGQGTGRLDLARATSQQVRATVGSLSMGVLAPGAAPVTKTLTYADDSDGPVTLALATDAPGVSLGAASVTVPAHGTAAVPVTFTAASVEPYHLYGGWITATSGVTTVRTTVGAAVNPVTHQLTVEEINQDGAPDAEYCLAYNLATGDGWIVPAGRPVDLPEGRYAVMASINTARPHRDAAQALVADPELALDRDARLTMDARSARPAGVLVDRSGASAAYQFWADYADGDRSGGFSSRWAFDIGTVSLGTVSGAVSSPHFHTEVAATISEPWLDLSFTAGGDRYTFPGIWWEDKPGLTGDRSMPVVDGGRGRPEDLAGKDVRGAAVLLSPTDDDNADLPGWLAALARAGAAMVLFVDAYPDLSTDSPLPLPVATSQRPQLEYLRELAAAGPVTMSMRAVAVSPYAYDLDFVHPGTVPTDPVYRVHDADLARTRTLYRAMGSDGYLIADSVPVYGPAWREVLRTPGSWRVSANPCGCLVSDPSGGVRDYHQGRNPDEVWNSAVVGPAVRFNPGQDPAVALTRDGDILQARVPLLVDPAGLSYLQDRYLDADGWTRLSRDGQVVGTVQRQPGRGDFTGVKGEATYRLDAETSRSWPWWELSTDVSGSWTFRSAHTDGPTVLPLLAVRFSPALDPTNTAPAGRRFTVPVAVQHTETATAPVTALAVQVSYDDGRTWQPATVRGGGDSWTATLDHPAAPGYVSLRAQARDQDGNTVDETILRAYRLR